MTRKYTTGSTRVYLKNILRFRNKLYCIENMKYAVCAVLISTVRNVLIQIEMYNSFGNFETYQYSTILKMVKTTYSAGGIHNENFLQFLKVMGTLGVIIGPETTALAKNIKNAVTMILTDGENRKNKRGLDYSAK
jgi:hypothetical protein